MPVLARELTFSPPRLRLLLGDAEGDNAPSASVAIAKSLVSETGTLSRLQNFRLHTIAPRFAMSDGLHDKGFTGERKERC